MHGKSGNDGTFGDLFNNPKRAPLDLDAAIHYMFKNENVNFKRVGIIGASIGANLAAAFASKKFSSSDSAYKIKSVVVLSAKTSAAQNLSGQTKPIVPKNAFYIASEDEQGGKRADWAKELFDKTRGVKRIRIPTGKKHGSYILREHPDLQYDIVRWFNHTL
jgi:dienelactone hydrolase